MRKTRDLFKKIGDTKGTNISYKDRRNKGQKQKDLTEVEEILKRWQEYTKELYKKALNDPLNHNGGSLTYSQTSLSVKSRGL